MTSGFCDDGPMPNTDIEGMSYHNMPSDHTSGSVHHQLGSIMPTKIYDQMELAICCSMEVVHLEMSMCGTKRHSSSSRALPHARSCFSNSV